MKYRRRPTEIEAVQVLSIETMERYCRTGWNWLPAEKGFRVYNQLHDSWIKARVGDYLNITVASDVYPIDKDYFLKHYEAAPE